MSTPLAGVVIDSFWGAVLNARVQKNQHRWLLSVRDRDPDTKIVKALKAFKEDLKRAWMVDKEDPESFPINTGEAFFEIRKQLVKQPLDASRLHLDLMPPLPSPPEQFLDLVDESEIETVFEQQNEESYKNALKLAMSGGRRGELIWRKILLAVDHAHFIKLHGPQVIPKPRIQFLHRELLKMTEPLGINDLTHEGIAEFLDDMCPCGIKHKSGTIRKLRNPRSKSKREVADDFYNS